MGAPEQTITGSHTIAITLNSAFPEVLFENGPGGTLAVVDAYASFGQHSIQFGAGGTVVATLYGAVYGGAGTAFSITNAGTIETQGVSSGNPDDIAIILNAGSVANAGMVQGGSGIAILGSVAGESAYIGNTGLIEGTLGVGVLLEGGGLVINDGGVILGGTAGVDLAAGGTVENAGYIAATQQGGSAVLMTQGGVVINQAGGTILGAPGLAGTSGATTNFAADGSVGTDGVVLLSGDTLINAGTVIGGRGGVGGASTIALNNGGNGGVGVYLNGGVLVNAGTILPGTYGYGNTVTTTYQGTVFVVDGGAGEAGAYAVKLGNLSGTIMLEAGAVFGGSVTADASVSNALVLGEAGGAGSFDMGGTFSGFDIIQFEPGANWTLAGTASELAAGETIEGFTIGDTLTLDGVTARSASFGPQGLVLTGKTVETLDITGSFPGDVFVLQSGSNGSSIFLEASETVTTGGDTAITLNPATPVVTFTSAVTVDGYGSFGTYLASNNGTVAPEPIYGAVFGAPGTLYLVTNAGVIDAAGTNAADPFDAGIFLDNGAVENTGQITGAIGIIIETGGTVENTGTITASRYAAELGGTAASYFENTGTGTIIAGASYAVQLLGGGLAVNAGQIINSNGGILFGAGGTVVNSGAIESAGKLSDALVFQDGGAVTNQFGGTISGFDGISAGDAALDVSNTGTIEAAASAGVGIALGAGGSVQNLGTIVAIGNSAIYATSRAVATVSNYAMIVGAGSNAAIDLAGGGTVFDRSAGTIEAAADAISLGAGGTVLLAGLVEAGSGFDAIDFGTGAARLILDAGLTLVGAVAADSSFGNVLELAAGIEPGSFDMAGTVTGFGTIQFENNGTWTLGGSTAELGNGVAIDGFGIGDQLILEGFTATSETFASGELVLSDGASSIALDIAGSFSTQNFTIHDTAQGTQIVVCHLRGTMILTPGGERAIEELAIGDEVVTRFGGVRRIKWIGEQRYARGFLKNNRGMLPVHIAAGALGEGCPKRCLSISPGHSVLLDGILVLARDLVNGVTVTQGEAPEEVHYLNIELETHDCVLAEGIWSETYADCLDLRAKFHNAAQFEALYPGQEAPAEPQLCAPRPVAGLAFEAALWPVLYRAEAQVCRGTLRGYVERQEGVLAGWAVDMAHPELMPRLEILLDGQVIADCVAHVARDDVRAAGYGAGRCGFSWAIPEGVRGERLEVRRVGDASLLQRVHELAVLAA